MAPNSEMTEEKAEKEEGLGSEEQNKNGVAGSGGEETKEQKKDSEEASEESNTTGDASQTEGEKPGGTNQSSSDSSSDSAGTAGAENTEAGINPSVENDLNNVMSTLQGDGPDGVAENSLDMLMDVNVTVSVELGKVSKPIEEILKLAPGKLVELDRSAGENVDLFLNDILFAHGEVTVINGNYAVRIIDFAAKS